MVGDNSIGYVGVINYIIKLPQNLVGWRKSTEVLPLLIHILSEPATPKQIIDMLQANRFCIKTVVDIRQQILAGGGKMHSDCEGTLLDNGSEQSDIWGASWNPITQEIFYESMVNLRPRRIDRCKSSIRQSAIKYNK